MPHSLVVATPVQGPARRPAAGRIAGLCLAVATAAVSIGSAAPVLAQAPAGTKSGSATDKAAAASGPRGEIILTGLPRRGTKAYRDLLALAGPTAEGQVLAMSKSEMWSMPSAQLEIVMQAAIKRGVKVMRLGDDWNSMLKPMAPAEMKMTPSQDAMMSATKGIASTMSMGMMAAPEAPMVEYALTKNMDKSLPDAEQPRLVIPLGNGKTITVRRTRVDTTADGCVWRGVIEGGADSMTEPVTLMWWASGRMAGTIHHGGRVYSLKSMGKGMHAVVETDPRRIPDEHGPAPMARMAPGAAAAMPSGADPVVSQGEASAMLPFYSGSTGNRLRRPDAQELETQKDALDTRRRAKPEPGSVQPRKTKTKSDKSGGSNPPGVRAAHLGVKPAMSTSGGVAAPKPVTITAMVAYTRRAASYYANIATDVVALSIEETNQAFRNSKIGHIQIKLVHTYLTDYDEGDAVHFDHVYRLADRGDGFLEEVHKLRDRHKADIVLMVVDDRSGCGLATRVAAEAEEAFAVVHHECAVTSYTLAHEVGHLLGARHDKSLDQSTTPFSFGFGYVNDVKWRTMMAYKAGCNDCPRLPIWSNPALKYKGEPVGTELTNNAKAISIRAPIVAGFR